MPRPGRSLASLCLALALLALAAGVAFAPPGDLDSTFDGDGKRLIDHGGVDSGRVVLVQPDGKIVIAGLGTPDKAFTVTRLNPDGSPDTSFSGDGEVAVGFVEADQAYAAALAPGGKIVVAGKAGDSPNGDVAILRLNPDGTNDDTFDGNGTRTINYGGDDSANAVLVLPDGSILVAGTGNPSADVAVAWLRPDGSLDDAFDDDGIFGYDLGEIDVANALALQQGRILVAGTTTATEDAFVLALHPDGTFDETFNPDGAGLMFIGGDGEDVARALLVQPDQRIVMVGDGNPSTDITVWRIEPDGQFLDSTFDGKGFTEVDFDEFDFGHAAALQTDGKIVVAGYTTAVGDFVILRFQPGGSLDTTFSGDGVQLVDFGDNAFAFGMALQPDGKVVAAGEVGGDIAVARLEVAPGSNGPGGPGGPGGPSGVSRCARRAATIVGTPGRDVLRGTRRPDVIAALGGNDRIRAAAGNDFVCAGAGNDRVSGSSGRDRLFGQGGGDRLRGGPGKDLLRGGRGRDRCRGGPGRDRANCERERA